MDTELAQTTYVHAPTQRQPRAGRVLGIGLLGGLVLGIAARGWMRLIAEEPAFTWSGTIFIVSGFTIFGITQSLVSIAHRRQWRRAKLSVTRAFGVIGLLPLFVAAGAIMMPTVVGAGLASSRRDWRAPVRWIWSAVAAVPVLLVTKGFVDSFGWSLHTLAGFALLLTVYGAIVWAARFTFSTRPDGWRLPRWARVALLLVLGLATLFFTAGFLFR